MPDNKQGYVDTEFWSDGYTESLPPLEKLLFLYFLTCPHRNISGVFDITIRRMCFETGLDESQVEQFLEKFSRDQKVRYMHGKIVMLNFFKRQRWNSNMAKGALNRLKECPDDIKALMCLDGKGNPSEGFERVVKASKDFESLSNALKYMNLNLNKNLKIEIPSKSGVDEPQPNVEISSNGDKESTPSARTTEGFSKSEEAEKPDPPGDPDDNARRKPFEDEFEEIWEVYPRKERKKEAFEAYQTRRRAGISRNDLLYATNRYAKAVDGKEKHYIMMAGRFFGKHEVWRDFALGGAALSDGSNGSGSQTGRGRRIRCPACGSEVVGTMASCGRCGLDKAQFSDKKAIEEAKELMRRRSANTA
jgi:hypothetical protein